MKIITYDDMKIRVLYASPNPTPMLKWLADTTQKQQHIDNFITDDIQIYTVNHNKKADKLIAYLLQAGHTSLFEHMTISFGIEGVSRSLLAQLTRHRMAAYTVASQHYQTYTDYPAAIDKETENFFASDMKYVFGAIDLAYSEMIEAGVPKEEARQVLPNAKTCNLVWTLNARSLINFLNLRLCLRNVKEMRIFANKILNLAKSEWWPALFLKVGPDCKMLGHCRQGHMNCGKTKE